MAKKRKDVATVLIVEDEADARDVLARVLTAEGYNVSVAANGWEGLLVVGENPPHLIVLDMMMPCMDGMMFLRSLRGQRTYQHLPVIVLTAMDAAEIAPKVRPLGVQHVIAKGDSVFPKLKAAMRTVLGRPRPHARVVFPEPGSTVRPYLNLYMKVLAWS